MSRILEKSPSKFADISSSTLLKEGVGYAHGTFGELLQGALHGDRHFLVTLPVAKYAKAVFTPCETLGRVMVTPAHKVKSLELATKILAHFQVPIGGYLTIESDLPEAKGMASSSADMVATARAVELAINRLAPLELILTLLRSIEPTDGVMYPDFVSFFHRRVDLCQRLGYPSRLTIVGIDEGGEIDTIEYNKQDHIFHDAEYEEYAVLLEQAGDAIARDDLNLLGQVATRSAILHQKRNPKRFLGEMLQIRDEYGLPGVAVTHSGPCIGLILPYEEDPIRLQQIEQRLGELSDSVFSMTTLHAEEDLPFPK